MAAHAQLSVFFLTLSFLFFKTLSFSSDNEKSEIQAATRFTYLEGSKDGPEEWGNLSPNYIACSLGKSQSPIDIITSKSVFNHNLKQLDTQYSPRANATLVNNLFNIEMHYEGNAGALILDGKNYTLAQMHWHSPSEHTINGVRYDAELHIVHKADDGGLSVVAILYEYGNPDPLLAKMQNKLSQLANEVHGSVGHPQVPLGIVDINQIWKQTNKYFRYNGSLTTPPCSEIVIWNILGKVRSISKEQVEELKAQLAVGYKNNSRPVQPLNGREVEMN